MCRRPARQATTRRSKRPCRAVDAREGCGPRVDRSPTDSPSLGCEPSVITEGPATTAQRSVS